MSAESEKHPISVPSRFWSVEEESGLTGLQLSLTHEVPFQRPSKLHVPHVRHSFCCLADAVADGAGELAFLVCIEHPAPVALQSSAEIAEAGLN